MQTGEILAALRLRLPLYGAIALALLLGGGWLRSWLQGPDLAWQTIVRDRPVPTAAPPAVEVVRWKTRTVVREVTVYEPAPKDQAALERRFNLKLGPAGEQLLTKVDLEPMPQGGEAVVTIDDAGRTKVTTLARPRRFLELGRNREAGALYSSEGLGLYYRQDLVRIGPAIVLAQAEVRDLLRKPNAAAAVGIAVRF